MKKTPQLQLQLLEAARSYVGLTVRPSTNQFLTNARLSGNWQWDGVFVDSILDSVMKNGERKLLPKHQDVSAALSFYIRNGWLKTPGPARTGPQPGDLVFFSYSTEDTGSTAFLASRLAIVTESTNWKEHGSFQVVEANINSGQPRGSDEWNGVFERTRYASDVIGYVNIPQWMKLKDVQEPEEDRDFSHTVRPTHLERCSSRAKSQAASAESRKSVELVQLALAAHPASQLQKADRGVFNAKTRAALAAFQRFSGFPSENCAGLPDVFTLQQLAASPYVRSGMSSRSSFLRTSYIRTRRWRDLKTWISSAISVPTFDVKS
ncbi:MAG: hypothetical protein ACRC5T_04300 [Cetobacterium sp.]